MVDSVKLFGESLAGRQGLEPRYADPESAVLPLDDLPDSVLFYHRLAQRQWQSIGLAGAPTVVRLLQTLLFGVSSRDTVVYAAVVLGVVLVGPLANFIPARRAASVDPLRALGFE
jgi:hypothetical protein